MYFNSNSCPRYFRHEKFNFKSKSEINAEKLYCLQYQKFCQKKKTAKCDKYVTNYTIFCCIIVNSNNYYNNS